MCGYVMMELTVYFFQNCNETKLTIDSMPIMWSFMTKAENPLPRHNRNFLLVLYKLVPIDGWRMWADEIEWDFKLVLEALKLDFVCNCIGYKINKRCIEG
jgi:hypothetical protein